MDALERITYRACHLCEALCGLEIRTRGEEITGVRGDLQDPFSRGHICPKAVARHAMYGHLFMFPIPDVDHTAYWLILGANPIASNGSIMTVPDVAKRLKAIKDRGGKVIVIDPCRTETADAATRHHPIRPGTDAAFLGALVNAMLELGPPRIEHYGDKLAGLERAIEAIRPFGVERAAAATGISAEAVRAIAKEFRDAPSAVAYGRVGLCTQPFGTACQWLIQLVNLITGNLDAVGGAMPTLPAVPMTGPGTRPGGFGSFKARVSGRPVFSGELPAASMAEEIESPGEGRIRAMLTIAGNPVSSTPNGTRLDRAFAGLDFMAAIDIYVNETTRHADVILPPASMLSHENYDVVFNAFAVRNVARHNPAVFEKPADARYDWEIFNGLGTAYAKAAGVEYKTMPNPMTIVDAALRGGPYKQSLDAL